MTGTRVVIDAGNLMWWSSPRSAETLASYQGDDHGLMPAVAGARVGTIPCAPGLVASSLPGVTRSSDTSRAGVVIYTAQSCPAAPGVGGWAFVAYQDSREIGCALGGELITTGPRMDLTATAEALEALTHPRDVVLFSDSRYVVEGNVSWLRHWERNGMRTSRKNHRKTAANIDLWERLSLAVEGHNVTWRHIRRDAGAVGNEYAHQLAATAGRAVHDNRAPVFQVPRSSELIDPRSEAPGVLGSGVPDLRPR